MQYYKTAMKLWIYEMQVISWLSEELQASENGLCSTQSVSQLLYSL